MRDHWLGFLADDSAATAVEYGIICACMFLAIVGAVTNFGGRRDEHVQFDLQRGGRSPVKQADRIGGSACLCCRSRLDVVKESGDRLQPAVASDNSEICAMRDRFARRRPERPRKA